MAACGRTSSFRVEGGNVGNRRAPCQGGAFQWVQAPPGDSLQPEAIGAVMEVTKWLKPSISVSRFGDSASVQAATRVNAEQALYGSFSVKWFFVCCRFLVWSGKAVPRPVACDQVRGARGRCQGTEMLAQLSGLPLSVACVSQRLDA